MALKTLDRYITLTPGVLGGKPCVAGRRIAVEHVAAWFNDVGMTIEAICRDYALTPAEVHAALAYYFDHQQEIDDRRHEGELAVEAIERATTSTFRAQLDRRATRSDDAV